ncbi:hypothetical protein GLOIN_2v1779851 [Rhizophagus irregularis DAOM 181602=DAOM 197198]|nr:hypothetical protein GLOIN_2v1779851 [Rhizophagus irregularis DAOM 181602=DAOM 197198]
MNERENSKDSIGWLPKNENPKIRSGGLPKNENPKIRLGGLLKNENPKIRKFVSFQGSGKGELRFGWLLKPRFISSSVWVSINVFELKSTVSHFPDRIVSASLSWMIGSISKFQNVICNNEHIML